MFNNIEDYEYKTGKRFYTTLARVAMRALDWDKHNKMLDDGVIDDVTNNGNKKVITSHTYSWGLWRK